MKKSIGSVIKKKAADAGRIYLSKQTWICFGLMAILYLFSLFGGMFSVSSFTYAEF